MPTFVKTHKVNISPTTFNNIRMLNTEISAAVAAMSLQSCPTLFDPIEAAHRAPPSLGFSRQEHWSGLPFPSPTEIPTSV